MENFIYGIRSVIEAVEAGKQIERVFIKKGLLGELSKQLFGMLRKHNISYQFVPIEKLNRITRKNHQGIVATISLIEYSSIENIIPMIYENGETPFILVLDRVSDVRNFGAIARTASCAGVHAIVIAEKGSATINADAIKTSAGALHSIPVCRTKKLSETVKYLKNTGLQVIAASEKADANYYDVDYQSPTTIIMGAEDKGISTELIALAEQYVKIPLTGHIASLNVSAAAAVMLFEVVKQRRVQ